MNKPLRVLAIVIGVVVLLGVAAALILPRVIDPNVYRDRITALVKEKTGRELVIAGDIGWSVFPWLGVELGEVRLANAQGFGDQPFAQVAGMQVRVKLLPLLRKEVEMSTVVLDGLQLNLAKDGSGRTNWQDLLAAKPAAAPGPAEEKPAETPAAPLAAIAIGGVQIRDARLVWDDRAAGTRQAIEQLNVQLGAIEGAKPVELSVDFRLTGEKPARSADVKLTGVATLAESRRQLEIGDLKLAVNAAGEGLPGNTLAADLSGGLALDLDKRTLAIRDLLLQAFDLRLRGQAQGSGIGTDALQFTGTLKMDEFAPRELLKKLGQKLPETSDAGVLAKAGAEFAFKAGTTSASLSDLKLQLDDTHIGGSAGIRDFASGAVTFDLVVDAIDLDRYLPPRKPALDQAAPAPAASLPAASQPAATPAQAGAGGAALLPVETLRGLKLNGTLKIGQLKAYKLKSRDVSITLAADDGLVRAHPASARMYEGSYQGDVTVDVRGQQPRIAMNERLSGVQIEPLLKDMLGKARLTGTANMALALTATGNQPQAIRQTMNGNASFAFTDGVIKGLDVLGEIRKAYAVVRGKPPGNVSNETEFSALTGTAAIANGVVNNPDLQGKSPLLQVQGNGTANLVTESLDYRIIATLVDTLEGKGELTGRPIPVHITGSFDKPKVGVDLEQVLKQEVQKKIEEKLQDKLKGGLKGLFGQ